MMLAFYSRFGELAFKETRSVSIPAGNPVPADDYGFLEYYCPDVYVLYVFEGRTKLGIL